MSADITARGLIAARPSPELVATFTQTDVLLAETRECYAACQSETERTAAVCADIQICEVRGWILDELAARGELALIDPAFA